MLSLALLLVLVFFFFSPFSIVIPSFGEKRAGVRDVSFAIISHEQTQ